MATWIPWTTSRLSYRSGYGAGVTAPGWYQHLWTEPTQPTLRWTVRAARTLREEDLPAPHRERDRGGAPGRGARRAARPGQPRPRRDQREPAGRPVRRSGGARCRWSAIGWRSAAARPGAPGGARGAAPPRAGRRGASGCGSSAPTRRKDRSTSICARSTDRARSRLLHRLRLLEVPWGAPAGGQRQGGDLPRAVGAALAARAGGGAGRRQPLGQHPRGRRLGQGRPARPPTSRTSSRSPSCSTRCVLAELARAVAAVLARLQERAALSADVAHLAAALPRLARLARYGSVRGRPGRAGAGDLRRAVRAHAGRLPAAPASRSTTRPPSR